MANPSQQLEKSHKNNLYSSKFELGLIEKSNNLLISNLKGNNILEFGCGLGLTTACLLDGGNNVTSVEQSNYFISQAKKIIQNTEKIRFVESTWENFESSKKFTDIVIFRGLDCVNNVEKVLQKVKYLSTSETAIHIVITNTESFHRVLADRMLIDETNSITNHAKEVGRLQALNFDVMTSYFQKLNFDVVKYEGIGFKMFPNSEMDKFSEERMAAFLDLGNVNPKLAVELYFNIKCR